MSKEPPALEPEEIKCLQNCFDLFGSEKQDFPSADDLDEILRDVCFEILTRSGLLLTGNSLQLTTSN